MTDRTGSGWNEFLTAQLATADIDSALRALLESVAEYSNAEMAAVAIFVGDAQLIVRAVTPGLEAYLSQPFPLVDGSVTADALAAGVPLSRSGPFGWQEDGPEGFRAEQIVAVPLTGRRETLGVLYAGRRGDEKPFSEAEVSIAARFAHHAALALEMQRDHDGREVLDLLERQLVRTSELSDAALQELYALILGLDGLAARFPDSAGDDLDVIHSRLQVVAGTLRQIMADQPGPMLDRGPLRQRLALALEWAAHRPALTASLTTSGPLEAVTDGPLADDLVASLRLLLDGLPADVRSVTTDIDCTPSRRGDGAGALTMTVSLGSAVAGHRELAAALAGARRRAHRHGGHVSLTPYPERGETRVLWSVPLRD